MKREWLAPWIGCLCGLIIACGLSAFFGENPFFVLKLVTTSFMNSKYDFGLTLFYTTCLIFSGLSFAIPLRAGLFHIGSEGQLILSAAIGAAVGASVNLGLSLNLILLVFGTICSAVLGAWLIAAFKYFRQAHEVVVAIMLNFIFAALSTWLTINRFQNPESQNPESKLIHESLQFMKLDPLKVYFDQAPVSSFFLVAAGLAALLYFLESRTLIFKIIRSYGSNNLASRRAGFSEFKILSGVMMAAGFFSGMVALTEVLGSTFQYKIGFSPAYGFLGIAVALLARQNFLGVIASAFLLAVLHKGASDLDLETANLTRDFSRVLQALIIFSVAVSYYLFSRKKVK